MKKLIYLLLFAVCLSSCGSNQSSDAPAATPQSTSGTSSVSNAGATEAMGQSITQGIEYLNKGDVAGAVSSFNEAIAQNPSDPRPYIVLGETYMRLQNYDRALETYRAALQIDPNNGLINYLTAFTYSLQGDTESALPFAQKSTKIFQEQKDDVNFVKSVALLRALIDTDTEE